MIHCQRLIILALSLDYVQGQDMYYWFDVLKYKRVLGKKGTYTVKFNEIYQNLLKCAADCVKVIFGETVSKSYLYSSIYLFKRGLMEIVDTMKSSTGSRDTATFMMKIKELSALPFPISSCKSKWLHKRCLEKVLQA